MIRKQERVVTEGERRLNSMEKKEVGVGISDYRAMGTAMSMPIRMNSMAADTYTNKYSI